jgi:hypothetical protein
MATGGDRPACDQWIVGDCGGSVRAFVGRLGPIGDVSACLVAAVPTVRALAGGDDLSFRLACDVPVGSFIVGSFIVGLDAASAFFLLPVLVFSALAAVYGGEYMQAYGGDRSLGGPMFSFNCSSPACCSCPSRATESSSCWRGS